jgi:acyl-CoA synthetase (AMP-forming)/AMP-acid ligase II
LLIRDILEHNARVHPSRVALSMGDRSVTYLELRRRVRRHAAGLRRLGLGAGDRIAILAHNSISYVESLFAVTHVGAALVPLNNLLIPREIAAILADADVAAVLYEEDFRAQTREIAAGLPGIRHFVCIDEAGAEIPEDEEAEPEPPISEKDIAMVIYTRGPAGASRGAMLSHRNLFAEAASSALELGLSPNDIFLACAPVPFLGGTGRLLRFFFVGATIVLQRKFDPEEALRTIERRSVTRALFTPTMMAQILDTPAADKFNLTTLKTVLYGASTIPLDLLRRAIRFFHCGFCQLYGHIETAGLLTFLHEEDHSLDDDVPYMRKLSSVGKEAIGVKVRVVDEAGGEIAPNQVGEVMVLGPNVFEGYLNDPGFTAEVMRDGWLRTGDIASVDDEGYIYIVDRKRDIMMVGGISVDPREVENVLSEHPSVKEAAVVACPDYTLGEVPMAVLVLREGEKEDRESVLAHCRRNMAPFKVPRSIEFAPVLPRNAHGKVLKAMLRDRMAARRPN